MAELADALDSGSSESNFMQVRPLLLAPKEKAPVGAFFFWYMIKGRGRTSRRDKA